MNTILNKEEKDRVDKIYKFVSSLNQKEQEAVESFMTGFIFSKKFIIGLNNND